MSCRNTIFIALALLMPRIADSESHALRFVREIGVGWQQKSGWMSFVSFSADGTRVASDASSAPDDVSGDLTLWSFPGGRLIRKVPARPTAISRDWKYYASYNGVGELETGKPVITLPNGTYAVYAFTPDSRYVAESAASHIRIVELSSGKPVTAFGAHHAFSLAISPDGVTLAAGYWNVVTLWNLQTGKWEAALAGFGRYVEGLAFSKDGTLLAGGTDSGGLQIWDVRRRVMLQSLQFEGGDVSAPAFSPDGRLVAAGTYCTGSVWLVDTGAGKILDHQTVSDLGCGSVAFSPDGRFLITPSTGGLIKWPYDRGGTIRVFEVISPK